MWYEVVALVPIGPVLIRPLTYIDWSRSTISSNYKVSIRPVPICPVRFVLPDWSSIYWSLVAVFAF